MSWLEAADRGTSCTPWHRGPPFLVASGALRRISQDSASVPAELFSMRPMDCRAGGVTLQKRSESCSDRLPREGRNISDHQGTACHLEFLACGAKS